MSSPWERRWDRSTPETQEGGPWTKEYSPQESVEDIVGDVFGELGAREGEGDDVTDVPTRELGVTEQAEKAVGASSDTPASEVAKSYLSLLDERWGTVEGYSDAPPSVKKALLDSSYNMGEGVTQFPNATEALKRGDYVGVVEELLDTANVGGMSLRGLARRRAELYNEVSQENITQIEQMEDGTILYKNDSGTLFRYKPSGGRHEASKVGVINLDGSPGGVQ